MTDKLKNEELQTKPQGAFRQFLYQIRLSWALLMDNRVPLPLKVIPIAAIAYVISPIDLIPDIVPILGQLDDIGVLMLALATFNSMAPADVVEEHKERINFYGREKKSTRIDVNAEPTNEKPK
jgi:uncharacterized membrane protein YkvA (DUF1232 family)